MQVTNRLQPPVLQILTWNVQYLTMKDPEKLHGSTDCSVDWACLRRWAGYIEQWLANRYQLGFRFVFLQEFVSTLESHRRLRDICSKWHMTPYIMSVGRFHACILVDATMVEHALERPYQKTGYIGETYSPYYAIGWKGLKFLLVNVHAPHGRQNTIRQSHHQLLEKLEADLGSLKDWRIVMAGDWNHSVTQGDEDYFQQINARERHAKWLVHTTEVPNAPTCCYHGDRENWLQSTPTLAYDHIITNLVDAIHGYPVLVRNPNHARGKYHSDHLPVTVTLRTPRALRDHYGTHGKNGCNR
jgi:hypothetical protein